jgi:multidrug efflux pump subunit AcrB
MTLKFINHVYDNYYKSYLKDSEKYEKINNRLVMAITILGFLVSIIIGLNKILEKNFPDSKDTFTIISFVLPSLSSILLMYLTQKGFKRKEELRENARIESKYLINEAKIRFAMAKDDEEYRQIYVWLNEKINKLQQNQAKEYFVVHNNLKEE